MPLPRTLAARVRALSLVVVAAFAAVHSGCVSAPVRSSKLHNDASVQLTHLAKTAAVSPEITLNQLSAGGVREQRDDWTQAAREAAFATLQGMRPDQMVCVRDDALAPEIAAELAEVRALYRVIDLNLTVFGNPMIGLPTAAGRFDYSVGSVDRICEAVGADALLLIWGEDDYFTGSRKFMTGLGVVASIAASAVTGTGVFLAPSSGTEHVSAALVARDGTLLWYDVLGSGRIEDMRQEQGVRTTIENLLRSLPAGQAQP